MSEAVARYVADHHEQMAGFLAALVGTPSDNPPGDCAAHAELTARLLEAQGLTVERHPVATDLVHAEGMTSVTNLIVRHRFGDGPVIALNAHGDVVPPGSGWTHDPYGAEIVDGWMVGRGVAVSKSDIVTYTFALLALIGTRVKLRGTVELHFTWDEEAGGEIGPRWLLEQGLTAPDLAIAAGFSYQVVTAHNGCLHLEVVVTGRSAHAAKPSTGIDALEAATAILTALYAHRRELASTVSETPGIGSPQLTVGLISGGINTNVVPDRVTFRLDRRLIPEEDSASVEAGLRRLIGEAAGTVDVHGILLANPLTPLPGSERLADALTTHATRVFGEPIGTGGVPLYTDARHYAEKGIPIVLYGAGPRSIEEANAHRADERLPLADLHRATLVVARAIADILA